MVKTMKGWINSETCGDGRESINRRVERETCQRGETRTKIKRAEKSKKEVLYYAKNL